nr:MAG TPA: hypothetical protein [Bacteriophage sp.]
MIVKSLEDSSRTFLDITSPVLVLLFLCKIFITAALHYNCA